MVATVRAAEPSDEARLFTLVRLFSTPTPPGPVAFRTTFHAKLADERSAVFVSERDGRLLGYVSGYCHATFYAAGSTAWVDEIMVAAGDRGAGVGQQLMAAFERWAVDHKCVLIGLATRGAAPFYERLGYASTAGYFKKYLGAVSNEAAQSR
jgi:GNAT superfamily N-acetyltransferase